MGMIAGANNKESKTERFAPASSFLEAVEYDKEKQTMDVTFKNGNKQRYVSVSPITFLSFKQSPSHSVYYARAIKGNLVGVKLISNDIGHKESTPLKRDTKEHQLDRGIKEQRARKKQQFGTIARIASNAAVA